MVLRRQDLAGDRCRGLHDESSDLAFELGEHAGAVALGGFARPDHDLFGRGDRLPGFLCLDTGGRRAGFLDQLLSLGIGFRQDTDTLRLDAVQFGLDLLGVGEAARDLLAPRLEYLQDRLVGEQVQHDAHDAEADDL